MDPAERISLLIRTLPPLVAVVVWDVFNGLITESTIAMANQATDDEYRAYEVIRCVAIAKSQNPPILEARSIVVKMLINLVSSP